jgi:hypothetical protein
LQKDVLRAFLEGEDIWEKFGEATKAGAAPFTDEILTEHVIDAMRNSRYSSDGRRLFNPEAPLPKQLAARAKHVAKPLVPGIARGGYRKAKALTGHVGLRGKKYSIGSEISADFGFRNNELDVRTALGWQARGIREDLTNADGLLTSIAAAGGHVSTAQMEKAVLEAKHAREAVFRRGHKKMMAGIRLGVPRQQVLQRFSSAGISKNDVKMMYWGITPKQRISKKFEDIISQKPGGIERLRTVYRKIYEDKE